MPDRPASSGYLTGGLPYDRIGSGPRTLLVINGLTFENKSLGRLEARFTLGMYAHLADAFTIYVVNRRPRLPGDYSLGDMAADYAAMIEADLDGPVDVIGMSTGGCIAQHLAADHPHLVGALVIHSSAYRLTPKGAQLGRSMALAGDEDAAAVLDALLEADDWRLVIVPHAHPLPLSQHRRQHEPQVLRWGVLPMASGRGWSTLRLTGATIMTLLSR